MPAQPSSPTTVPSTPRASTTRPWRSGSPPWCWRPPRPCWRAGAAWPPSSSGASGPAHAATGKSSWPGRAQRAKGHHERCSSCWRGRLRRVRNGGGAARVLRSSEVKRHRAPALVSAWAGEAAGREEGCAYPPPAPAPHLGQTPPVPDTSCPGAPGSLRPAGAASPDALPLPPSSRPFLAQKRPRQSLTRSGRGRQRCWGLAPAGSGS